MLFLSLLGMALIGNAATKTNQLVKTIHQVQSNIHYSRYHLGQNLFDLDRGVYILDCSSYVDDLLQRAFPNAFQQLSSFSHTHLPNSNDYYHFINHLPITIQDTDWEKIEDVGNLHAGDILVFRYKRPHYHVAGHVMVVVTPPEKIQNQVYVVKVADSTPFPHSNDTRRAHAGVGVGDMLLKVNSNGEPVAYAWRVHAGFESKMHIVMARVT
ncbi:MAG: hypothetical protein KIT27_11935 [Legionellales bacterium]|nr:hypothetical protein [Legionellales bacterium]